MENRDAWFLANAPNIHSTGAAPTGASITTNISGAARLIRPLGLATVEVGRKQQYAVGRRAPMKRANFFVTAGRFFFAFLLLVVAGMSASAQIGRIEGNVKEKGTGKPVAGAQVGITGETLPFGVTIKTNVNGNFLHAGMPLNGTYKLSVSADGFDPNYIEGIRPNGERVSIELVPRLATIQQKETSKDSSKDVPFDQKLLGRFFALVNKDQGNFFARLPEQATRGEIQDSKDGWTIRTTRPGDNLAAGGSANLSANDYKLINMQPMTVILLGAKLRFPEDKWVNFLGVRFRKGGVEIQSDKLIFSVGTQYEHQRTTYQFDGTAWHPQADKEKSETKTPGTGQFGKSQPSNTPTYPVDLTTSVQGRQVTVRWEPGRLSQYKAVLLHVYRSTGRKDSEGKTLIEVQGVYMPRENVDHWTLTLDSGTYFTVLFGKKEPSPDEQISSTVEFRIP